MRRLMKMEICTYMKKEVFEKSLIKLNVNINKFNH